MMNARKYEFNWNLLGDISLGRPNLGANTRIEVYRLMQFSFRDIIEQEYGTAAVDKVFYAAGKLAGCEFYEHLMPKVTDFSAFIAKLQELLLELGIGVLRVEKADLETGSLVLTVSEDLDCSGLPDTGDVICIYDEGFIAGLLQCFTGKEFTVKEVDCWCVGDRTCRFTADVMNGATSGG